MALSYLLFLVSHVNIEHLFTELGVFVDKLHSEHPIKSFDCSNSDLNDFLFDDALLYTKYRNYITYIIGNNDETIAYYSLANDSLRLSPQNDEELLEQLMPIIEDAPDEYVSDMINSASFPAVKIGRLAVNHKYQKLGIGTFILNAIIDSFIGENKTGCQFITVESINTPGINHFYQRNGFNYLTIADHVSSVRQMYKCLLPYIVT